ncbi:MAG TPA: hypothetical protein VNQ15_03300, partial [Verrucomicrobiae bacterium]|nr:hypothetical protein [Verrucomicrobiae bacterium]
VADDLRAPARPRGEEAVIQKQVHRGTGNDGRKLLQQCDGLEEEVRRAIAPTVLSSTRRYPSQAQAAMLVAPRPVKKKDRIVAMAGFLKKTGD